MSMTSRTALSAFAPYRISPVGAHTDHQRGLTCGLILREGIHCTGGTTADGSIAVRSGGFDGVWSGSVAGGASAPEVRGSFAVQGWSALAEGVLRALRQRFGERLSTGMEAELRADLPCGGIASSATLQVVILRALLQANGLTLANDEGMRLIRDSEQCVTGVPVGLLDPGVILHGRERTLVVLDCEQESVRQHRFAASFPAHDWWLVDAQAPRLLAQTPYAQRVAECAEAARLLGVEGPAPTLAAVRPEVLRKMRSSLPPKLLQRAEHVLAENKRVKLTVNAIANGDLRGFAALVNASADSLTHLFEVGVPATLAALKAVRAVRGVHAATFAGGGFGGHLLVLSDPGCARALAAVGQEAGLILWPIHTA